MHKFDLKIPFATLIPEFAYQALSTEFVEKDSITCLELEDIREALLHSDERELKDIRAFLGIGNDDRAFFDEGLGDDEGIYGEDDREALLEGELEEVDADLYHKYTPGEIKFILGEIIENIDAVYDYYYEYSGLNLVLTSGFVFQAGEKAGKKEQRKKYESGFVVEFFKKGHMPELPGDVFVVSVGSQEVSDTVSARVYFTCNPAYMAGYERYFAAVAKLLNIKEIH